MKKETTRRQSPVQWLAACLLCLVAAYSGRAQDKVPDQSALDSAIYYLQQAAAATPFNERLYAKGLDWLYRVQVTKASIERLEQAVTPYRKLGYRRNLEVQEDLMSFIANNPDYDLAIATFKQFLKKYESSAQPVDREIYLNTLSELRIPYRRSSRLDEGFEFFTNLLKEKLQQKDSAAVSVCYYVLSGFYQVDGLDDLGIYHLNKSMHYLDTTDTRFKVSLTGLRGWINHKIVFAIRMNRLGKYRKSIRYGQEARQKLMVYNPSNRPEFIYILLQEAHSNLMLGNTGNLLPDIDSILVFAFKNNDYQRIANAHFLKGIYYFKLNQNALAEASLKKSIELVVEKNIPSYTTSGSLIPYYYLALIKMQENKFQQAEQLLNQQLGHLENLRAEQLLVLQQLIHVYLSEKNHEKARETFNRCVALKEALEQDERINRTQSFETEQKIALAEKTISDLETEGKVAALTRNYLIGIAALLLLAAAVFYNRFRVTRIQKAIIEREKRRSERLLLNILPAEVAEELKETGKATAQSFDRVSILFTDFKDFMLTSKKLSAAELVAEIDHCYREFDAILEKYRIEKIKTIGDSYMAAGGLPVPSTEAAKNTVLAALEMQAFIASRKAEREAQGQPAFEMRLGIHSGPVVAGIVGIKKFQYDIWGDAVNTASRMETSGAAGKVNISQATYELIKDNPQFAFDHRGKVTVKGIGAFDMWFVERAG